MEAPARSQKQDIHAGLDDCCGLPVNGRIGILVETEGDWWIRELSPATTRQGRFAHAITRLALACWRVGFECLVRDW
jgi:hypothetical protein